MCPNLGEDLLVRREAVRLILRVDALAVERHVEHAAVPALEAGGDPELFLDRGLQTGGLRVVVSFGAIGDLDLHAGPSFLAHFRLGPAPMIADPAVPGTPIGLETAAAARAVQAATSRQPAGAAS
jgi:hypothetical protein